MPTKPSTSGHKPHHEHSVPFFWPIATGIELEEEEFKVVRDNLKFVAEAEKIIAPPPPEWPTPNRIALDLDTMRLRNFSAENTTSSQIPVVIDAPYAGHS